MKRRNFLKAATTFSAPILLGGMKVAAITNSSLFPVINNGANNKILVVIQLNGGNDGLNMLVPIDQYESLLSARSNIMIPENKLTNLTDTLAVHPAMEGVKQMYDDAKLSVIQSVGYPDQNRSHFRSKDIWMSGSKADEYVSTGWIGRYFDTLHSAYPIDYPNADNPDPIAITVGSLVSETCQGIGSNFSMALKDPFALSPLTESQEGELPDNYYGEELAFLKNAISQTNAYGEVIVKAAEQGTNAIGSYPEKGINPLAEQLKIVANLISGGLQTKVYIVSLGGFDTHSDQVMMSDTALGEHAVLLGQLSEAIESFQKDLEQQNLSERVVGMTFSEFGRRIRSNGSFGTDHGSAAPLMIFGSCVNGAIIGDNPVIPEEVGSKDGVAMQFDFRSVYGSLLIDWFEAEESTVRSLLYDDFQYIPLVEGCNKTTSINTIFKQQEVLFIENSPNPFSQLTNIYFESKGEHIRLSIFDANGSELAVLTNQHIAKGKHQVTYHTSTLAAGNYYCRMQTSRGSKVVLMVKVR